MICIIIGGASASGKTFLSEELLKELRKSDISSQLINMDNYFHERPQEDNDPDLYRQMTNFDTPAMLHLQQLSDDLMTLNKGQSVDQKTFEFKTNRYKKNDADEYILQRIAPSEVMIIEGIFAQYFANNYLSPELAIISVNVANSSYPNIIKARIQRDTAPAPFGRGLNKEQVLTNEHKFVGAGFYQYTAKNTPGSDIYVLNDHENDESISFAPIIQQIMDELEAKQKVVALNQLQPRKKAPNAIQLVLQSQRLAEINEPESLSQENVASPAIKQSKKIGPFFKAPMTGNQNEQFISCGIIA